MALPAPPPSLPDPEPDVLPDVPVEPDAVEPVPDPVEVAPEPVALGSLEPEPDALDASVPPAAADGVPVPVPSVVPEAGVELPAGAAPFAPASMPAPPVALEAPVEVEPLAVESVEVDGRSTVEVEPVAGGPPAVVSPVLEPIALEPVGVVVVEPAELVEPDPVVALDGAPDEACGAPVTGTAGPRAALPATNRADRSNTDAPPLMGVWTTAAGLACGAATGVSRPPPASSSSRA